MATKSRMLTTATIAAASVLALTDIASAHPGHATGGGFAPGAAHPLTGLDHVLVMIAVGLCAAQMGGRAIWLLPVTFLAFMGVGGAIGIGGHSVPMPEQMIAASVLVLGLIVAFGARLNLGITAAIVALFAIFHGYAHGSEMGTVSAVPYAAGFLLASAALHGVGITLGLLTKHSTPLLATARFAGGAIALCGLLLLWT